MTTAHGLNPLAAAKYLHQDLGRTIDEWMEFLARDRMRSVDVREIAFTVGETGPFYHDDDLFYFVHKRAARNRAFGPGQWVGSIEGATFGCGAKAVIDEESGGRPLVEVMITGYVEGRSLISPEAAHQFAAYLIRMADLCYSHMLAVDDAFGEDDQDLYDLLAALGTDPPGDSAPIPETVAEGH